MERREEKLVRRQKSGKCIDTETQINVQKLMFFFNPLKVRRTGDRR